MHKSIFRTNHTYHNCLPGSSHLETQVSKRGGGQGLRRPVSVRKLLRKLAALIGTI